ncbi:MAG: hypothetical protein GF368_01845 [Candidatus Aenigmarchaeota archaeon]|nr:hypothetical protein [Candidatus Aenigmarchaeota archaeon]
MRLIQRDESGQAISCKSTRIGCVGAMVRTGNPHPTLCPHSVRGLEPEYIEQNLPTDVSYDPKADCSVIGCGYYQK